MGVVPSPIMRALLLPLVFLVGCSLVGDSATVAFEATLPVGTPPDAQISASVGGRDVPLGPAYTREPARFFVEGVRVGAGRTRLGCAVERAGTTSRVDVRLNLDPGLVYNVLCEVAEADRITLCRGCRGSERADLPPALGFEDGLALYLIWGSHNPDNPVDH